MVESSENKAMEKLEITSSQTQNICRTLEKGEKFDLLELWMLKYQEDKVETVFSSKIEDFEVKWHYLEEHQCYIMLRYNRNFAKNVS